MAPAGDIEAGGAAEGGEDLSKSQSGKVKKKKKKADE